MTALIDGPLITHTLELTMSLVAVRHYTPCDLARLQAVRDCWTETERLARRQAAVAKWREVERLCTRSKTRSRAADFA